MRRNKVFYYVATGLLTILMLYSVSMYFFNHEEVKGMFTNFGYPTYIIYPYAVVKLLGLFAIWNHNFQKIKEWAYAGFFFDTMLAFWAHYITQGGGYEMALGGILFVIVSYIYEKKVFGK